MLGFMNPEAFAQTQRTGEVVFFSRSRNRLWKKGETSGHVLKVLEMRVDCDADALLVAVEPVGPASATKVIVAASFVNWIPRGAQESSPSVPSLQKKVYAKEGSR